MDVDDLLRGLDSDQARAVTEPSSPLAIVAAAGSGKTMVLTRRIAYRTLTQNDVHAQHVLALTFTSHAARELQRRLRKLGLRERVEAGTFHATALRLLRQRAFDQGHQPPSIATDRIRLMHDALRTLPATGASGGAATREHAALLLAEVDWCRARRVTGMDVAPALRRAGRRTPFDPQRLAAAAQAYSTVKKRRAVMDFDDLLEQCLHALQTDSLWAAGVRWRFRHLFVDEAQDLNPLQHGLLEAIRNESTDLCLVGDPRQAIFGFNGADPEIMNSVERQYPGVTVVRLRRNYRCSPQIVGGAATVLANSGQDDDSIAVAAEGPAILVVSHADENSECAAVPGLLREMTGTMRPWRSCAVLARTVVQLTEIAGALARSGVPCNVQDRAGRNSVLGTAIAEADAQRNPADLAAWIERVSANPDIDPVRARVAEAADRFVALAPGMTFRAWTELHSVFDGLESADMRQADAVELLTFHAAKGREWPFVIITGVEPGLVPHHSATTPAQRDEEARLLYVACTRARERLTLSWAAQRNGRAAKASSLIDAIINAPPEQIVAPAERRPPRPMPDPVYVALVTWRRNAAKAAQVDPSSICSDESLRAVAQVKPTSVEAIASLTDLGPLAAARVAPRMLAALNRVR